MTECTGGSSKAYVGDIGTEILVDVCVDITESTSVSLSVLKPGATTPVTWMGGIYQLQYVRYVVQAGDFSVAGEYKLQVRVVMPSGAWRGDMTTFRVYDVFE
jgi:hypothetical protein